MAENDRLVTMPSLAGDIIWIDLDHRFLYEDQSDPSSNEEDLICCTRGGFLDPQSSCIPLGCRGQMVSSSPDEDPLPHNHDVGVPESFLRFSVLDFALLNFYALLGLRTTLSQFYHLVDYYREILDEPGTDPETDRLDPEEYFAAADRRAPYKDRDDYSSALQPAGFYRASSVTAAAELNVHFIQHNFGHVMETFVPPVDLGYAGMLDVDIPDSREPYVPRFPPSGITVFGQYPVILFISFIYFIGAFLLLRACSTTPGGLGQEASNV